MLSKKGIIASPGIAIAKALVYEKVEVVINQEKIDNPATEIEKLNKSLEKSGKQLEIIKTKAISELGQEDGAIFGAHIMVLQDPEFIGAIETEIVTNFFSADYAVAVVTDRYYQIFDQMEDDYFRGRAADIKDVGNRVLNNILGVELADLNNLEDDVIIIADDLTPSDTAQMDKKRVKGFATNIGSRTSHTAIMARSLEIPAVLGLEDITGSVKTGDTVVVDGLQGIVSLNPDELELEQFLVKMQEYADYLQTMDELDRKSVV